MRERQRVADENAVRIVLSVPPVVFVGWQAANDSPPEPPTRRYSGFRWFRRPLSRPTLGQRPLRLPDGSPIARLSPIHLQLRP